MSPWASPIVLVSKKDGGVRPCVDYRKVNELVKPETSPPPPPEGARLSRFSGSLIKIKIFLANPKQIATQMFLGFLGRNNLPRQHTKSIPKSENMKFVFFPRLILSMFWHILLFKTFISACDIL